MLCYNCHGSYIDLPAMQRFSDVVDAGMLDKLLDLMTHRQVSDNGLRLLKLASQEFWLTAEYAGTLLGLMRDSIAKVDATVAMLPRVVDVTNLNRHLLDWLTDAELFSVRKKLGVFYDFVRTNPTGHYKLQLGDRNCRRVVNRLIDISGEETRFRKENNLIDTSQKGDFENWRNETLNGVPYDFDTEVASSGGMQYGLLEFDYVSTNVMHRLVNMPPMPQPLFEMLLHELNAVKKYVTSSPSERSKRKHKKKVKHGADSRIGGGARATMYRVHKGSSPRKSDATLHGALADGSVDESEMVSER